MNVMMVRAKIKEENVAEAQAATGMVLQALEQAQLNVRYAASTLSDGVTLVAFLQLEPRSGASAARVSPVRGAHRAPQGLVHRAAET